MARFSAFGGLILLALFQTGCCCLGGPCGNGGCGRTYWGAYCEDPPGCEPCDRCANWVGHGCSTGGCSTGGCSSGCDSGCASIFPWQRSKGRQLCLLNSLFTRRQYCGGNSGCCEATCEATCEPSCAPTCEATCEPACGEPGCGCTNSGGGHAVMMDAAMSPPWPTNTVKNVSYRRSPASFAATTAPSKPCNCNH